MYTDSVTVFTRYEDSFGDITWYPTVIHGVNLMIDKAAIVAKLGAESKDNAVLNIHYRTENGQIIVADKPYLTPMNWERQTNDKLPLSITFASGTEYDFFMLGDYGNTEPIKDEDFKGFFSYMKKEYDYVFAITSVAKFSKNTIPHFEIMGK